MKAVDVHFEFFSVNLIFKPTAREYYRLNTLRCECCQCQVHFCHSLALKGLLCMSFSPMNLHLMKNKFTNYKVSRDLLLYRIIAITCTVIRNVHSFHNMFMNFRLLIKCLTE